VDRDDLTDRLAAVERRLTDGETPVDPATDVDALAARVEELETGLRDVDERVDELERGVQALRGYVGGVEAVNDDVERRAEAALAAVDRLEARLDADDPAVEADRAARTADRELGDTSDDGPDGWSFADRLRDAL